MILSSLFLLDTAYPMSRVRRGGGFETSGEGERGLMKAKREP